MAFSEIEKENIKNTLCSDCEKSWSKYGYKKTSVDELCSKAGISKGAFYLFFKSKEDLFYEVITSTQEKLVKLMKESLGTSPTKYDLSKALKIVFREYIKYPFIYEINTPDFIAFINKLPPEKINALEYHGNYDILQIVKNTTLTYKVDEAVGNTVFSLLFTPNWNNDKLPCDYLTAIDFLIDTLTEVVFE